MEQPVTTSRAPSQRGDAEGPSAPSASALDLGRSVVDFDLAIRVERALQATGHGALRSVKVSVQAEVVTLSGWTPTYYLKQLAQEAAQAASRSHRVRNDLDVGRPT